jgi:hypothetical protein
LIWDGRKRSVGGGDKFCRRKWAVAGGNGDGGPWMGVAAHSMGSGRQETVLAGWGRQISPRASSSAHRSAVVGSVGGEETDTAAKRCDSTRLDGRGRGLAAGEGHSPAGSSHRREWRRTRWGGELTEGSGGARRNSSTPGRALPGDPPLPTTEAGGSRGRTRAARLQSAGHELWRWRSRTSSGGRGEGWGRRSGGGEVDVTRSGGCSTPRLSVARSGVFFLSLIDGWSRAGKSVQAPRWHFLSKYVKQKGQRVIPVRFEEENL